MVSAAFGLVAAGAAVAYCVGYEPPSRPTEPRLDATTASFALRLLTAGWGPASEELTSDGPPLLGVVTLLLAVATAVRLAFAARDPRERLAASGLLTLIRTVLVLAAGIAYGRSTMSDGAMMNRYVTLMAPLLSGCYPAWARFGPPRTAGVITGAMALAAAALAWPNAQAGLTEARDKHLVHSFIERDVCRGVPRPS